MFFAVLISIVLLLIVAFFLIKNNPSFKGFLGERKVNKMIRKFLPKNKYYLIPNATLVDDKKTTTQIDHIVVSRYGIFVIETKNYQGFISGDKYERKWRIRRNNKEYTFQNPLHQNYRHQKAVSYLTGIPEYKIFSLVVFMRGAEFSESVQGSVSYPYGLIDNIKRKRKILLSKNDVFHATKTLEERRFIRGYTTNKIHLLNLKRRFSL